MSEAETTAAHSRASGNPERAVIAAAASGFPTSRARAGKKGLIAVSLAVIVLFAAAGAWIWSLGPAPLGQNLEFSKQVLDRNGRLLRAYATIDGRWRLPAKVSDVDPRFFDVL